MVDKNEVLEGEFSRRKFLRASGAAGAAALSGCIGGDGGPESNKTSTTQQDSTTQEDSTSTTESEPTESGQTEEGYQTEDSGGLQKALDDRVRELDYAYGFKIDGMEHLNVTEEPDAESKYDDPDVAPSVREALYLAATDAGPFESAAEIYFFVDDPESAKPVTRLADVQMFPVDDKGNYINNSSIGGEWEEVLSEQGEYDPDTAQSQLESFFRERIDGDPVGAGGGIDHAVDLEDFPYAVEALQSGYDPS